MGNERFFGDARLEYLSTSRGAKGRRRASPKIYLRWVRRARHNSLATICAVLAVLCLGALLFGAPARAADPTGIVQVFSTAGCHQSAPQWRVLVWQMDARVGAMVAA
jgi:hypothetical protein